MLIDWFTVMAQIVNFVILVALLKYFLFDRITKAMAEREEKIRSALDNAEALEKHALAEIDRYRGMNEELDAKRTQIIAEAKKEADSLRKVLMGNVRAETNELKTRWLESIQREKTSFLQELRRRIAREGLSIARAVLMDLADVPLEHQVVEIFKDQVRSMPEETLCQIREVLGKTDGTVSVRTAFELSQNDRESIAQLLTNHIAEGLRVLFEQSADPICGIEMRLRGYRIAWSIDSYLDTLEKYVSMSLGEPAEPSESKSKDPGLAGRAERGQ